MLLSLALILVAAPTHARLPVDLLRQSSDAPPEAAQRLHRDGDQAYERDEFSRARDAWIGAYNALPTAVPLVSYRVTLLTLISDATLRAHDQDADPAPLRVVVALYETFLARHLAVADTRRPRVEEELTRLKAHLPPTPAEPTPQPAEAAPTSPQGPTPATVPESTPEPAGAPDAPPAPRSDRSPSRASVALLSVGSVALAGGLVALVVGTRFTPRARDQVDAVDDPVAREDAFLAAERRKGAAWMVDGGLVAAAGLALTIAGTVLHMRGKRGARRTALIPSLERPGLVLTGRF